MAAKVIFDRSKPFGHIFGDFQGSRAAFEQGGYYFDAAGELVEDLLTAAQREEIAKAKKPINPKAPKAVDGVDVDDLNLTAWVKGEIDYPFPAVREAAKRRYSVLFNGPADLAEYLAMEANLVPVDEIAPKHRASAQGKLAA